MTELDLFRAYNPEDLSTRPAEEIDEILRKLAGALDLGRFKQGELLSHMNEGRRYVELINPTTGYAYKTFGEYCEASQGIALRTARSRISVFDKLIRKLDIPPAVIEEIGWSKAALLAPKMDNISVQSWIAEARGKSYRQLREDIRAIEHPPTIDPNTGEVRPLLNKIILQMTDEQMETFDAAIDNASRSVNHRNKSRLIEYICMQYNADAIFSIGSANKASQLEWFIQRMEDTFGVKLAVVRDSDKEE